MNCIACDSNDFSNALLGNKSVFDTLELKTSVEVWESIEWKRWSRSRNKIERIDLDFLYSGIGILQRDMLVLTPIDTFWGILCTKSTNRCWVNVGKSISFCSSKNEMALGLCFMTVSTSDHILLIWHEDQQNCQEFVGLYVSYVTICALLHFV